MVSFAFFILTPPRTPEPIPPIAAAAAKPPIINGNGITLDPPLLFHIL